MPDRHASSARPAPISAASSRPDNARAEPEIASAASSRPGKVEDFGDDETAVARPRIRVLLPLPFDAPLDYGVDPDSAFPEPGSFVVVPLGPRRLIGVVWDAPDSTAPEDFADSRLKNVEECLALPPLRAELRRFIDRCAAYTLHPPGIVLRMAMSASDAFRPLRQRRLCGLTESGIAAARGVESSIPAGARLTPARCRVLAVLLDGPGLPAVELARLAGTGIGVVRGLIAAGLVDEILIDPKPAGIERPDWRLPAPELSADQSEAARHLVAAVGQGGFTATLLDGVTGSGKTETYFAAIAAALERGRQVLVLLPEIALGAVWLDRFRRRFGTVPTEWHSDLGQGERGRAWRAVADGRASVVFGARSALFLPFADLGLIIVDEEHDPSFKQEDGVCYQARDMAVLRASLAGVPVMLVSATPSLETMINVARGRYRRVILPRRHAAAAMPAVQMLDLRRTPPSRGRFLAEPLVAAIGETLAVGEQALLFLNRRGYAPLTLCRACGHRFQCPSCTAWLVEHRFTGRLLCHHCGHSEPVPAFCPECLAGESLVPCGPGVERLLEEATARFPQARIALMVSDMLSGPRAAADLARGMTEGAYDLLIGTQIVAKGHHFPMLTLVGIVDADLGLAGGDLRAAERTFQLLHQVGGRAGRAERPGRVLLQSYMPELPVMRALAAGERDGFLKNEAAERRAAGLPPFGRLAALILSGPDAESVDFAARALARAAPQMPGIEVLGPAPAPLAILRGRHRRRFLLKTGREVGIQAVLRDWLGRVRVAGSVRLQVDVDPYSFL